MEAHAGELGKVNTMVVYHDVFDEYALTPAGDPSPKRCLEIRFCPFCGVRLPNDKRRQWYEALKQIGVDPEDADSIPASFKSSQWWKSPEA
jgi:hypothetical protein